MNKQEAVAFLFTIVKELQRSFESPVILFTERDYADCIFRSLVDMREALLVNAEPKRVADIVNLFHMEWLQAVQDVEQFKRNLKHVSRDVILRAIKFTMECTYNRCKYLNMYIQKLQATMTEEERDLMQADLDILKDMSDIVQNALQGKEEYLRFQADPNEYHRKLQDETDELLYWLDKLNDNLALQFTKVLDLEVPLEPSDLTKTLKDIVDEVSVDPDPETRKIAQEINEKGKVLSYMIGARSYKELEIRKVIEKIKDLEERTRRLGNQQSSAFLAVQHKTMYLRERLESLENIKTTYGRLRTMSGVNTYEDSLYDDKQIHIFNHLLPHPERCRLVEQLVQLWDSAIGENVTRDSIISILSVINLKEVFSDELGHFIVDKHGRKIYTKEGETTLYQLNESNTLVPLSDDDKHIYFYDECGRYYFNKNKTRVYQAFARASEYLLNSGGELIKYKEERSGIHYYYDNLGRYFINEYGRRVYRMEDSDSAYERDGLGNLIKIRNEPEFIMCPTEAMEPMMPVVPMTMPECKYLKQAVGAALTKCIADVVRHQPNDPIAYLANSLEKYRQSIDAHQKLLQDKKEMSAELDMLSVKKKVASLAEQSCMEEESTTLTFTTDFTLNRSVMNEELEF